MRYKLFGKHTGLRVSELVLGTGNFGTRWGHGSEPEEARRVLDTYAEAAAISSTRPTAISSANRRRFWVTCSAADAATLSWRRNLREAPARRADCLQPATAALPWSLLSKQASSG